MREDGQREGREALQSFAQSKLEFPSSPLFKKTTERTFSVKCRCHLSWHPKPCPGEASEAGEGQAGRVSEQEPLAPCPGNQRSGCCPSFTAQVQAIAPSPSLSLPAPGLRLRNKNLGGGLGVGYSMWLSQLWVGPWSDRYISFLGDTVEQLESEMQGERIWGAATASPLLGKGQQEQKVNVEVPVIQLYSRVTRYPEGSHTWLHFPSPKF